MSTPFVVAVMHGLTPESILGIYCYSRGWDAWKMACEYARNGRIVAVDHTELFTVSAGTLQWPKHKPAPQED